MFVLENKDWYEKVGHIFGITKEEINNPDENDKIAVKTYFGHEIHFYIKNKVRAVFGFEGKSPVEK